MATAEQIETLKMLVREARASEHVWPEMAACEACLETAWLTSELGREYRNLFGQKCPMLNGYPSNPVGTLKVTLPTKEWDGKQFVAVRAAFLWFLSYADAFTHRMALLQGAALRYRSYAAALHAETAEDYVAQVSKAWSTDPERAAKVLEIYRAHSDALNVV